MLPRIYSVSPRDFERFHLRLLLLHVRGAQSFEHLRTVDGVIYETFQEAADKRNLLMNDNEWRRCLTEASAAQMPAQLRQTFALICAFNHPTEPAALFEEFTDNLIEDFAANYSRQESVNRAINEIQDTLIVYGLRCTDIGLSPPQPVHDNNEQAPLPGEVEVQEGIQSLNVLQREAFDRVVSAINNEEAEHRFSF